MSYFPAQAASRHPSSDRESVRERSCVAVTLALLAFLTPNVAQAYVDPGVGSMLFQILLAGFAGVSVLLRFIWRRIASRLHMRKPLDEENSGAQ
jgi:hypothetical protein